MSGRESDLASFANESISTTYEGPNTQTDNSAIERKTPSSGINHTVQGDTAGDFARVIETLVQRHMAALDFKSEEIIDLRVKLANSEAEYQAELDKKDEICQQQAIKITELNLTVEELKSELKQMRSNASEYKIEHKLCLRCLIFILSKLKSFRSRRIEKIDLPEVFIDENYVFAQKFSGRKPCKVQMVWIKPC